MTTTLRIIRAGALVAAVLTSRLAWGQVEGQRGAWVFTPYVGVFMPTNHLARFTAEFQGISASLKVKQDNALALGATSSYWFANRMALEVGGLYAFSHAGGSFGMSGNGESFSGTGDDKAWVAMGTTKLMYALLDPAGDRQLRFGLGPAIIRRGGTAYEEDVDGKIAGRTNLGAALSLCTRLPLTSRLSLRFRAEDYMYQSRLKFRDTADPTSNFDFDRRLQNDFIFSAGLSIGLNR